jgi:hypothetical protein
MSRRVLITSQDAQARWRDGGGEAFALGLGNIMSRMQPRVLDLQIEPGRIDAVVAGSRAQP